MDGVEKLPRSVHDLIILRREGASEPVILLLEDADGWALPRIESEERRSADVGDLNRAVQASLGLEVSVLRCLSDAPGSDGRPRRHLYTLEAHGAARPTLRGGRWVPRSKLAAVAPAGSTLQVSLEAWLRSAPTRGESGGTPGWDEPGWRDEALAWVADQLSRRGLSPVREVEQVRLWEFSHVLRLVTGDGTLYLKARPASGAAEAPLTQRLAERHPAWTPDLIAVEPGRRWLLMRETPGLSLMKADGPVLWERAAAAIAHMQIDWLPATGELVALGCPRVTLAQLEREIAPLLEDVRALQPHRVDALFGDGDVVLGEDLLALQPHLADGLTDQETAALRHRRPELEALCRELAAEGVPESLEHGDLWADNAIAGADGVVLIDWEDAMVAHPFFTPALLLLSLDYTEALGRVPDARRRLREAYLGPWMERGPLAHWPAQRLERTFELAQEAAMLHYARQFWRLALPLIETTWEVRTFAPSFFRRLITP